MLPTDSRARWDDHILNDPRVTHFWDEGLLVGRRLAEDDPDHGGVVWDAYLLYGPEARWEDRPPDPIGSGPPVVGVIQELNRTRTAAGISRVA